jgi:hypothetical protein
MEWGQNKSCSTFQIVILYRNLSLVVLTAAWLRRDDAAIGKLKQPLSWRFCLPAGLNNALAPLCLGVSDTAIDRVGLVRTGLEYTKKTRDLLAAAAAVRAGKSTRGEFKKIKAETDRYYSSLRGNLAVRVSRDIQSCLSLTPDTNQ